MHQRLIKETSMIKTHPMWNNFPNIQSFLLECLELIVNKTTIENKEIRKRNNFFNHNY